MVDELVMMSENDEELKFGLGYVDKKARKEGKDFYQMMFEIFYDKKLDERSKNWINNRN